MRTEVHAVDRVFENSVGTAGGSVRTTTLFNQLLGLQGAFVREVALTADAIFLTVGRIARKHSCPRCSFSTRERYDSHEAQWRHVPLAKMQVHIRAEVARIECPTHGVLSEALP